MWWWCKDDVEVDVDDVEADVSAATAAAAAADGRVDEDWPPPLLGLLRLSLPNLPLPLEESPPRVPRSRWIKLNCIDFDPT